MRTGVVMWPIEDWPGMGERWRRAEELGFDTGWVYDHTAWMGHTPWDDAYATLAAAAAITERMRLGTLVTTPNFRDPVPTAAAIRTIDRISGGRLTIGIGAGGSSHTSDGDILDREWTARERADRFGEWVSGLDVLLTQSPASYAGDHWRAREVTIAPGLVQQRLPFWLAAEGPRGMRLAAQHGQGWIVNVHHRDGDPPSRIRTLMARLTEICEQAGRDVRELRVLLMTGFSDEPWLDSPDAFEDLRRGYAELGVTDVAVHWPRPGTEWDVPMTTFEKIAERAATLA